MRRRRALQSIVEARTARSSFFRRVATCWLHSPSGENIPLLAVHEPLVSMRRKLHLRNSLRAFRGSGEGLRWREVYRAATFATRSGRQSAAATLLAVANVSWPARSSKRKATAGRAHAYDSSITRDRAKIGCRPQVCPRSGKINAAALSKLRPGSRPKE